MDAPGLESWREEDLLKLDMHLWLEHEEVKSSLLCARCVQIHQIGEHYAGAS
jgi:hypothetical protein